jgi:hypothetical protein
LVPLTEFIVEKRGSATVWLSSSYLDPAFVGILADADRLFENEKCHVIKDQRKMKIGRLTVRIAGEARSIYVKRYNVFSLRSRLQSLFFRSGALRSLQGADLLAASGIATATPVAGVEDRVYGMLRKSFFVSEEIAGAKTADVWWTEQLQDHKGRDGFLLRRAYLARLAALFHSLHARQIYHDDLKDANIMAVTGGNDEPVQFLLLDLEGVRRCSRLSERRRVKNLAQLYRTLGRHLTRSQGLCFLKTYLGDSYADRKGRRKLAVRVLRRAHRENRRKVRGDGRWQATI